MPSPLCGQRREESKKGQTQSNGVFKTIEHPPFEVGFLEAEPESEAGWGGGGEARSWSRRGDTTLSGKCTLEFWPKAGGVTCVSSRASAPPERGL